MSEPFLGEMRVFGFGFAPRGWAPCNGQLLPINQNQALFSILGTTFGGNGVTTFALPNFQGRVPMHFSATHALGESAGEATHTLTPGELPPHEHPVFGQTGPRNGTAPAGAALASGDVFGVGPAAAAMSAQAVAPAGGSQPHENMMPYLTVNICICLVGIFPSRN